MERPVRRSQLVYLAACGILAPLVYAAAAIAAGFKEPTYSHVGNFISELGATGAPGASLMNLAGFLPYGILILGFALGLNRGMRAEYGGWLGPSVLGVYGLAYIALAFAPCDPGCQAAVPPSLHHQMHGFLGDVIFLAIVVGPFALYSRMMKDPHWISLGWATLALPTSAWLILNCRMLGLPGGVRQRLGLLLLFAWIELVAIRLFGLGSSNGPQLAPQAAA